MSSKNNEKKYVPPNKKIKKKGFGNKWKSISSDSNDDKGFRSSGNKWKSDSNDDKGFRSSGNKWKSDSNNETKFRNNRQNNFKKSEEKVTFDNSVNYHSGGERNKNFLLRRKEMRKKEFIIQDNGIIKDKQNSNNFKPEENKKMIFSTSSFRPYVKNKSNTFSSDHFNIPEKKETKMTDTEKNFILNYVNNLSDNEESISDNEDINQ
jgi:hypothetical protein